MQIYMQSEESFYIVKITNLTIYIIFKLKKKVKKENVSR